MVEVFVDSWDDILQVTIIPANINRQKFAIQPPKKWAYPQMMVGLWRQLWLYTQRLSWIPQSLTCYPFICRGSPRIMYFLFVSQLFNSFVPRVYTIICP